MKKLYAFLILLLCCSILRAQPPYPLPGANFPLNTGDYTINSIRLGYLDGFAKVIPGPVTEFQLTKTSPGVRPNPNFALFQATTVWRNTKISLNSDFKICTQMNFGTRDGAPYDDPGGDGIAFILQNDNLQRLPPTGGGSLSHYGIVPSFAVEFDTFKNPPNAQCNGSIVDYPPFDPMAPFKGPDDIDEDHIGFARDGSYCHNLMAPQVLLPNVPGSNTPGQVEDGLWHDVVFEYNATTKLFKVTFDGSPYSITIDLKTTIFAGANEVYWGFGSGCYWATNDQRVRILSCPMPPVAVCDYNIYAFQEAKFYDNNTFDGNVGVRAANGKAEFKKFTTLVPGYVKAAEIKVEAEGSNVPNRIIGPDILNVPNIKTYAGNPDAYSNLDIGDNKGTSGSPITYAGNYKDVKIGKNSFIKLTGVDFKKIEVDEGSKVTLTAATIDIRELKVSGKDVAPAKICFTNDTTTCTNVRIGYKAELGYYAEVNKGLIGASPVVFYLATSDNKSIDFKVKKGSHINASAFTPNGKLDVEGDQNAITTMIGTYIGDKADVGKYVTWIKGNCCFDFTPPTPPCTDGFVSPDPAKKDIVKGTYTITDNGTTVTIRTTLAKTFTDNSYGSNLVNWGSRSHSFGNLTGSDKMQLALYNAGGVKSMEFVMDYLSSNSAAPSGFSTLGVTGGDGKMLVGDVMHVVNVKTSISENLKLPVFQTGFTTNSPATTSSTSYTTSNPAHSAWIFDVWYEVTVNKTAFPGGFGYPMLSSMHASPSKTGNNSEVVVPCTTPRPINNDLILGLEEQSELRVKVAPNPTNSYFQLKLQSSNQEKVIVRIMDAFGRPVKVLNNIQSNTTLVIGDDLKPGNYFAEIIQGNERKVVKLIKM